MHCCLDMLTKVKTITEPGSQVQCNYCCAVIQVDAAGAWVWEPRLTAEQLRKQSIYG